MIFDRSGEGRAAYQGRNLTQKRIMAKTTSSSSGIGFGGVLAVLFIGLKLTDNIDWSWWWVLFPLWISFLVLIIALILFLVIEIAGAR